MMLHCGRLCRNANLEFLPAPTAVSKNLCSELGGEQDGGNVIDLLPKILKSDQHL